MKLWSTLSVLALGGALAAATADKAFDKPLSKDEKVHHALSRLTFGERPGDFDAVSKLGLDKWIESQMHPEKIRENPALEAKLAELRTLTLSSREAAQEYGVDVQAAARAARKDGKEAAVDQLKGQLKQKGKNGPQALIRELNEAKIYRAILSERQLEEQLIDFWFNHFNVNATKGADRFLTTSYERDAIRPHIWGKFRDLLGATAQHPAMLFYLDNWQSASPEAQAARFARLQAKNKGKQNRAINENYARELLELHTLGVDNGYTQQDIVEVARCFTGWTIQQPRQGGEFFFNPRMHDPGEKTVLGVKIAAGGGQRDGERVLDILSKRPETAHFLSLKLAQRFVADDPPPALVDRMAKKFRETDGDLSAVVRSMISAPEFFSEGARNAKVKTPLEFVASAIRSSGAEVRNAVPLAQKIADLGQPLYRKVEPTGYSTRAEEWVNSAGLLARLNFATDLTQNRIPGTRMGPQSPVTSAQFGSPEFQRK